MGKARQRKHRSKELASRKPKRSQPDEYFSSGALEMARFGSRLVMRNLMEPEQHAEVFDELAKTLPEVCQGIDDEIAAIRIMVAKLPPGQLLQRAYWEMAWHHRGMASESQGSHESNVSLRMLDYIQSVIVSTPPSEDVGLQISENDWEELKKLVDSLFLKLSLDYQLCRTASEINKPDYDKGYDEYYYKAQMYWVNVRGPRYRVHEIPSLHDLLGVHDDALKRLFGIGSEAFIDAISKIQWSLTFGVRQLMQDLYQFKDEIEEKVRLQIDHPYDVLSDSAEEVFSSVIEENGWLERRDNIRGRLAGLDLFDVEILSGLPKPLLEEMSWEPGEEREFFAEGEFKGWPIRVWPVFKRPFIKLEGRYYCFDLYSLFDHLYRVVQRIILRLDPDYREVWNLKQNYVSENLPFEMFNRLLPGASIYKSIYYQWYPENKDKREWCETDGIVIYDDHLFIVEVKAGAFTSSPPATDFPAYIESVKNLLLQPSKQGNRFRKYLESDDEITLYDRQHVEITKLSRNNIKHITVCVLTLDAFTEIAAQVRHLGAIDVQVGDYPIWAISIDDLRVYADIFENPLIFLHFVEERVRAFSADYLQLEDELDHLGMYLKHNIYTKFAEKMNRGNTGKFLWQGYRLEVDKYFAEKVINPDAKSKLRQDMLGRLLEIIDFLGSHGYHGGRLVSSMLLNCDNKARNDIISQIDYVLAKQAVTRRPLPLSVHGEVKITVFCWQVGIIDRVPQFALRHTQAVMLLPQEDERLLLELTYNADKQLVDVHHTFLGRDSITLQDLPQIQAMANDLREKRIENRLNENSKIGRNELCPCGSCRKYKRCCGV